MWIPIALGRDVPAGTTRAIILDGAELVIWRAESGSVQVWEDRCPHRGMRLSFGFVRGEALNCLYHGWQYGTAGPCQRIPAHPDLIVPSTIRAKAYAATESGGLVLVNLGDPGPPPVFLAGLPIASLAIEADSRAVLQLLGGSPASDTQLIETTCGGVRLTIGWHAPSAQKTILHAVALDPGNVESKALVALHQLRSEAERKAA